MTPDTVLTLGDFEFWAYEIPERLAFGGEQRTSIHELVGGVRVVDAMGRADMPLEWSGIFTGAAAMDRARYLDALRVAGQPLDLSWSDLYYSVLITSFHADYHRAYEIPYRIVCTVVEDFARPVTEIADPGIDTAIADDQAAADALGITIGDGTLSGLLGTMDSAIGAVSSFAKAAQSTINSVLAPIAAVQARVQILIGSTGNTLANVATLGGILPSNPISSQVAAINSQVAAMTQMPALLQLNGVLGRMSANLGAIQQGKQIVTAGGNLYQMAAAAYRDATAWTGLAKANKTADPMLTGVNTIVVPPLPDASGGVLSA